MRFGRCARALLKILQYENWHYRRGYRRVDHSNCPFGESGMRWRYLKPAPEIRPVGAGLGLAANAVKALETLGLTEGLKKIGRQISHFELLDERGKRISITDPALFGGESCAVHRADLHSFLISQLAGAKIHLGKRLSGLVQTSDSASLFFEDGSEYQNEIVIGADGIHSAVRKVVAPHVQPRYAGYTCWRGVANIPGFAYPHPTETWGQKGRFGVVPLTNDRVYWFVCINAPENSPKMKAFNVSDLQANFRGYHQPLSEVLAATADSDLIWSDIRDIKPMKSFAFGRVLLIGDAAHATTPNMGQGACQAIEDAVIFGKLMEQNPETAFQQFDKVRKERVHWITNQSWKIGKVAQLTGPGTTLRNGLLRVLPDSVNRKTLKRVADFRLPVSTFVA